ncbi:hypothetical protein AB0E59_40880 [Lentzea sp. NPDC034063]|uniref:hypothetical protein n=1 Tax=unclassified Lentzea TaxID=2643253 RepID=UPI0033C19158
MTLIVPGSPEAVAVGLFPVVRPLLDLKGGGWTFLPYQEGQAFLDGFHRWPGGWVDSIRFHDEGDALGIRVDRDNAIVWELTDSLAVVVNELLLLPTPEDRLAPRLARGTGPA